MFVIHKVPYLEYSSSDFYLDETSVSMKYFVWIGVCCSEDFGLNPLWLLYRRQCAQHHIQSFMFHHF